MEWLRNARGTLSKRSDVWKAWTAAGLLVAGLTGNVYAGLPESGIYTVYGAPGRGVVIEYQNGIASVAVFAYNEITGEPEWYLASGRVRDDADEAAGGSPPLVNQGYYPIHWFEADLLRFKRGPCAVCYGTTAPVSEKVGTLALYVDYLGNPLIDLSMPAQTPHPIPVESLSHLNFGHAALPGGVLSVDLKGEWVFLDKSDPSKPAERYRFGDGNNLDRSAEARNGPEAPFSIFELTYRDEAKNASLRCRQGFLRLSMQDPPGNGCELIVGNEVRYSMLTFDIGLGRIQAFKGAMPPAAGPVLRGPLDIVGVRIE